MANYSNYFPQSYANTLYGYNNLAPTQPIAPPMTPSNQLGAINWVQGEAGARSVSVSAGQKVLLMDSENNVFYVKSSDATGMPLPLRTFEYKEIGSEDNKITTPAQNEYVTHEELKQILNELKQSFAPEKEEKTNEFVI